MLSRLRGLAGRGLRKGGKAPETTTLTLSFTTADDFAAFIDDPRARTEYHRLELRLDPWFPAQPQWTGRLGTLPGVRTLAAEFDPEGRTAELSLELAEPLPGAALVAAAFGVFYPHRRSTGFLTDEVGIHPGAPSDLRWHPGGGVRDLLPPKLKPRRYTDYELLVGPEGDQWLGDRDGVPRAVERPAAPPLLIDPKIHRPVERRQPSPETLSATAAVHGERLVVRTGDQVLIDKPVQASLTATDLRRLLLVTDIDASGMTIDQAGSTRLAELAAYGAVLHDAPAAPALDPALAELVARPFGAPSFLDHVNRSLHQVRAVMRAHTRVLTTQPPPSVSVLLPTVRPDLLGRILGQLAEQDHPDLEVVVGCHGFEPPARESLPEPVQRILGPMLQLDRELTLGAVLGRLSAAAGGDLLSKVDDDDWYGPHHLSDLVTAWHYADAQLVGRMLSLVHFEESDTLVVRRLFLEGYRWRTAGGGSMIGRHDLAAIGGWRPQYWAEDRGIWLRLQQAGGLSYTCTGPGYIHARHVEPHTWAVKEGHFEQTFVETTLPGIPRAAYGVM